MKRDILLYERLQAYNLNLHQLSERSGVAYSTVYNLFTQRKSVSDATTESLYRLARYLDMTLDELYHSLSSSDTCNECVFPDFLLMWEDEVISSVSIGETDVHIDRYILHPAKQIFYTDDMSRFEFGDIIRSRCWDENRPDIHILMNLIGLSEYDPYEICKKTHGRMVQDKTWFKFDRETVTYRELTEANNAS